MPQSVWTLPAQPGTEGITPDDVYYRGERDADFGVLLRRVAHRKGLASPRGAASFPVGAAANRKGLASPAAPRPASVVRSRVAA